MTQHGTLYQTIDFICLPTPLPTPGSGSVPNFSEVTHDDFKPQGQKYGDDLSASFIITIILVFYKTPLSATDTLIVCR